jgi:membrane protease subunit HflK
MGITLLDVNFQAARPPEEVKAAFDDAIAARENREQYVREAEAYSNEVQPRANGQAQRILEEGRAYKERTVLEAQGEVARFARLLPEYKAAPEITKERLYIETMERVLSHTRKVLISDRGNNLTVLPLDQLMRGGQASGQGGQKMTNLMKSPSSSDSNASRGDSSSYSPDSIMDQRRANALRNDTQRQGRE